MEKKIDEPPMPMVSAHALGNLLKDLSRCLSLQRDMGGNNVDLSPETVKLMDQWQRNKFRPMACSARAGAPSFHSPKIAKPIEYSPSLESEASLLKIRDGKPSEAASQIPMVGKDMSRDAAHKIQSTTAPIIQGRGTGASGIFFLGEVFSLDENQLPDITRGGAGDLFLKIVKAMNLNEDQAHIISFFSPSSHGKRSDEAWQKQVKTYVFEKIKQLNPRIICAMGEKALQVMLGNNVCLADGEGRFHNLATALLIPTFHPAQLIEDPSLKRPVWESMKRIMHKI